jgi:hypothetical protein
LQVSAFGALLLAGITAASSFVGDLREPLSAAPRGTRAALLVAIPRPAHAHGGLMNPALMNQLLRSPGEVARACKEHRDVAGIAASALVAIAVGAVLFGAAVGSWRGSTQIVFAALKLPVVALGTMALCVPAFYAISAVHGRPWSLRAAVSLMLASGARFSLVLLAATPVVWLVINLGASYDAVKLVASLAYALGGLAALGLLLRGLGDGPGRLATVVTFVGVFLVVGGQMAWILRPYLGTPDRAEVTLFTRDREGGLAYQLLLSAQHVLDPAGSPPQSRRPGGAR